MDTGDFKTVIERLNLQGLPLTRIAHEDAMVAPVYQVGDGLILKIANRPADFFREVYFLNYFAGKLPVPCIIQVVEPQAILMERLPGVVMKDFNPALAYEAGSLLAKIHLERTSGYGDILHPLNNDPRTHFTFKFEEGLTECAPHLPPPLLEKCRRYFEEHLDLLAKVDGPCIAHRDFRPGNLIVHEGRISGIIDWHSARASFAQEDFCPLEPWKSEFFTGYASVRPLPDFTEMELLLRLSRAIAAIGFTVKRGTWHTPLYTRHMQFLKYLFT